MSLNFIAEVWEAMSPHIDFNERNDAADTLVTLLIENNYEADEIKESFRGEKEIITALKNYIASHESEEEYEEYDDEDQDDWD